jgi:serine/threonine-protein kinase
LWEKYKGGTIGLEGLNLDLDRHPAVGIPHDLAEDYAHSVGGEVPTEAQWEYVARSQGKDDRLFVWKDKTLYEMNGRVRIDFTPPRKYIPLTAVADEYKDDRTDDGVLGMMGNVREWCRDHWSEYAQIAAKGGTKERPLIDPKGPDTAPEVVPNHVIRGGSFRTPKDRCYTTGPRRLDPTSDKKLLEELTDYGAAIDVGFRVVIECSPRGSRP